MLYRVLVTPRSFGSGSDEPLRILEEAGCEVIRVSGDHPLSEDELVSKVKDCDGMIVGLDQVSGKVIASAKKLKVISKYGVGLNNIDLEAAKANGVVVTFTPDANTEAVADLAIGLMLACARRIPLADRSVRSGQWRRFVGSAVWRKILGVVGTGRIGKAVIRRAVGFEMKILCYDIQKDKDLVSRYGAEYVTLDELLRQSDYITLHIPLTEATMHFIGKDQLSQMKSTAFLINTARGEIIDEDALYEALAGGRIGGAGLDVFCHEPPLNSKLFSLDNAVLTPHIGAHTTEAITDMGVTASRNLLAVLKGEEPQAVAG